MPPVADCPDETLKHLAKTKVALPIQLAGQVAYYQSGFLATQMVYASRRGYLVVVTVPGDESEKSAATGVMTVLLKRL